MIFLKNTKIKNIFNPRYFIRYVAYFLEACTGFIAYIFIIALMAGCIYLWYDTIYHPAWSDSQRQEYIKNKKQGVLFNKNGFEYDLAVIRARQEEEKRELDSLTDIFRLKQTSSTPIAPSSPAI